MRERKAAGPGRRPVVCGEALRQPGKLPAIRSAAVLTQQLCKGVSVCRSLCLPVQLVVSCEWVPTRKADSTGVTIVHGCC